MSMGAIADGAEDGPIIEMNTTPLIDVLLVLLIMFIITIPIQTHAVKIDVPAGIVEPVINRLKNKVTIDAGGGVFWNGQAIDLRSLAAALVRTQRMEAKPELHLQPDALAPYARVDEVLAVAKRVGVEDMGFVGNEQYREF